MAAAAGASQARYGRVVVVCAALVAGGAAGPLRLPPPEPLPASAETSSPATPAPDTDPSGMRLLAARVRQAGGPIAAPAPVATTDSTAPLPGPSWTDPDSVNWADVPEAERGPLRERLQALRGDRGPLPGERLLERLRGELRAAGSGGRAGADVSAPGSPPSAPAWPDPARLRDQLDRVGKAGGDVGAWTTATLAHLGGVRETAGPADVAAAGALILLGEDVDAGMELADRVSEPTLATEVRRAALAVARRVAVWRAATAACTARAAASDRDVAAAFVTDSASTATAGLLEALEGFESAPAAAAAARVHAMLDACGPESASAAVARAVGDHYLAPNVRIAVHRGLLERLLPEATIDSGPMQDVVLGRQVRGTRRVEQSLGMRFVPDPDEIRVELLVDGVVTSKTVTESGPVAIHSRGTAEFTVRKPVTISVGGLGFGRAVGTASNASRLADIQTDFDSLPVMGSLMRSIARNQHDDLRAEATREVNDKVIIRACREVDAQTEPKIREMADRVAARAWRPLVSLGLEPTVAALETTADTATARIRLAGPRQLAAHTPRPRAPADALLSVQVHESSVNNACERFGLAGRRLTVEALVRTICDRLGVPPRIPDELPTNVEVAFVADEPLRIECRDGLVHVRMALDAIESDRRAWYDVVAHVAYRPVVAGPQVFLEREGPVRLSGPGQKGRMEVALRTVFGKIFPKDRPVPLLPAALAGDRRLSGVQAVQAVAIDGWLALALAEPPRAAAPSPTPTAVTPTPPARRAIRR